MSTVDFEDFTEEAYRQVLASAKERYAFESYGTRNDQPHVLWRHDVDHSVHRAVSFAQMEAESDIFATYFFLLHSEFYNLLELEVFRRAKHVLSLGHSLGVHFDAEFYGGFQSEDELAEKLSMEASLLEALFEQPVRVFSLHNTQVSNSQRFDSDIIAGLINATGRGIKDRYGYVSDSNGYWRFDRLRDVVDRGGEARLQVLTHPEWWQAEPMSPRNRIERCIEGRSRFCADSYDNLLATFGRKNVR